MKARCRICSNNTEEQITFTTTKTLSQYDFITQRRAFCDCYNSCSVELVICFTLNPTQVHLAYNDFDDGFIDQLLWIVEKSSSCVKAFILDQSRTTMDGATRLFKNLHRVEGSNAYQSEHIWHTTIDDMKTKLAFKEESYRNLQVRVGPRWSKEDAQRANQVQQTWNEFFTSRRCWSKSICSNPNLI